MSGRPGTTTAARLPVRDESWMEHAECRGMDPELFFLERGERTTEATQVCASCPVRARCLDYAIEHQLVHGIWGGLGPLKRRRVARDRARGAA